MALGFLTAKQIISEQKRLFVEGFDHHQALYASYDLRLGEEVYISGAEYPLKLTAENPFVSIPRGQFALLITREHINLPPDYLGLISMKSGKKLQGLINVSGFHVDPGFNGRVVFSVFNAGPSDVVLRYEEPTFMIFFYQMNDEADPQYDGARKGQRVLPVDTVTFLKGSSASLADVDKRLNSLETREKVYWGVLIALVGALLAVFLGAVKAT